MLVVRTRCIGEVFARHGLHAIAIANHIGGDGRLTRKRILLAPVCLSGRNFESHHTSGAVLEGFVTVQAKFPDAELIIFGGGSLRGALEAHSLRIGLTGAVFTGPVLPESMHELRSAADVYFNASLLDHIASALLEAYVAGLPGMTSDAGGIPCIAHDCEAATLVAAGNVAFLADAMIEALADPREALCRAERARGFVATRFSSAAVCGLWQDAFVGPATSTLRKTVKS